MPQSPITKAIYASGLYTFIPFLLPKFIGTKNARNYTNQLTTEDTMVQEKKKSMEDTNNKKGRLPKEEERSSTQKSPGKPTPAPGKSETPGSRKSR